jgi:glucose-1-phosphate thymidylyltransferase
VVGLVPAAGSGQRIAPSPCSKEIYPIGFRKDERTGELRVKVASHDLLDKFRHAGIHNVFVVLRNGKWDIPAYFVDGRGVGLNLAYIVIDDSIGPPDSLDRAYRFVEKHTIAFGFPDIQLGPSDVFARLLRRQSETEADIVLGLYQAADVSGMDMIDFTEDGRVSDVVLKPPASHLRFAWVCAVWTAAFTDFLHRFVGSERAAASHRRYADIDSRGDLPVGAVIKAALENGLRVYGLPFSEESYLDIGTPNNLIEAVRRSATGV